MAQSWGSYEFNRSLWTMSSHLWGKHRYSRDHTAYHRYYYNRYVLYIILVHLPNSCLSRGKKTTSDRPSNYPRFHSSYGLPWWLIDKESTCSVGDRGDMSSIPGLGRSSGRGKGNPLQDSCLENPMDRGDWHAIVQRVAKSQTQLGHWPQHTACMWLNWGLSMG